MHQQDAYPANAKEGKLCVIPLPAPRTPFKGQHFRRRRKQVVYEKIARFSTNIWSITAGSLRVINTWTVYYSLYHVSVDRVGAINNVHWCVALPSCKCSRRSARDICPRTKDWTYFPRHWTEDGTNTAKQYLRCSVGCSRHNKRSK